MRCFKKCVMVAFVGCAMFAFVAKAELQTEDITVPGVTPEALVNQLLGEGVAVSNVVYTGVDRALGHFTGGAGIVGFEEGIILSTGDIANVIGPNTETGVTAVNGMPGDPDLDALIPGFTTYDAAILEFDFIPDANVVQFQYVFASDEYNEYVGSPFNDVFGFFINGVNYATLPDGTPISINNVNNGLNSAYYIDNDRQDGTAPLNTEMDGLTVVLTLTAPVNPGVVNSIKLAIADAGDDVLDSNVFIRASSFAARDKGDINWDGDVDIIDVMLCLRMAIDLPITIGETDYQSPYTQELIQIADMNSDGRVTISDAVLILRRAIGLD